MKLAAARSAGFEGLTYQGQRASDLQLRYNY